MTASALVQLVSACVGIMGTLFFAIGIMRQSVEAMGRLSGSYWDWNPNMPPALAAQKADYLFGGGLIVLAFVLQLTSYFVPGDLQMLSLDQGRWVPWVAAVVTVFCFMALRFAASRMAAHFQAQVEAWLKNRQSQT